MNNDEIDNNSKVFSRLIVRSSNEELCICLKRKKFNRKHKNEIVKLILWSSLISYINIIIIKEFQFFGVMFSVLPIFGFFLIYKLLNDIYLRQLIILKDNQIQILKENIFYKEKYHFELVEILSIGLKKVKPKIQNVILKDKILWEEGKYDANNLLIPYIEVENHTIFFCENAKISDKKMIVEMIKSIILNRNL